MASMELLTSSCVQPSNTVCTGEFFVSVDAAKCLQLTALLFLVVWFRDT